MRFANLFALDIAVVWESRSTLSVTGDWRRVTACSGRSLDSRQGPGSWLRAHRPFQEEPITGASYITLPTTLPPEDGANAWMTMEGLLALAWGGGTWSASAAAQELMRDVHYGPQPKSQARWRRHIRSKARGSLYARGPIRNIMPDRVEFGNGTILTGDKGRGKGMFVDSGTGGMINFTELFIAG